jgi:hypothetical protein
MLTHASFETDIPADGSSGAARAEPLARELFAALERRGLEVRRLGAGLDYAADFRVYSGDRSFYGMLGPVDDGVRQWLLSFDSQLPPWRRWFGATDNAEFSTALRAAHEALTNLPGVRSIRWYTPHDWNEAPDERWSPDPAV